MAQRTAAKFCTKSVKWVRPGILSAKWAENQMERGRPRNHAV